MGKERRWFAEVDGSQTGPLSDFELKELASGGKLGPQSRVRLDGTNTWVAAMSIRGLPVNAPKVQQQLSPAIAEQPSIWHDNSATAGVEVAAAGNVSAASSESRHRRSFPLLSFYCQLLYAVGCISSIAAFVLVLHFFSGGAVGPAGNLLIIAFGFLAALTVGLPFFLAEQLLRMALYVVYLLEDIREAKP